MYGVTTDSGVNQTGYIGKFLLIFSFLALCLYFCSTTSLSMASTLKDLIADGEALGFKDEALRDFVKTQQDIQREERQAERQQLKDEAERVERQAERQRLQEEAEREEKRLQEKAEREERLADKQRLREEAEHQRMREKYDREMQMQEAAHRHQMEILEAKGKLKAEGHDEVSAIPIFKGPKIPAFDEGKDEMDSYLRRFERYADSQKWPKPCWATNLSALLKGRSLDVYALMPSEDALDYDKLKIALLKRFDLTEDGFRRKFKSSQPETGETFVQFSVRLSSYLLKWLKMAKVAETFEALFDLFMRDQFLQVCNRDLALFLKERVPPSIQEMAVLADQYREARLTNASNLTAMKGTGNPSKPSTDSQRHDKADKKEHSKSPFVPKSQRRCFKCQKMGHIASECRSKGKVNVVTHDQSDEDQASSADQLGEISFVSTLPSHTTVDSLAGDSSTMLSSSCQHRNSMPISAGYVEGKPVTVLRDTGCNGIVVRRSKIDKSKLIKNKFQTCTLADGSSIKVPVATVSIDTPYLTGTFEAWCMTSPVYDLIIGNVDHVRPPGKPDPNWTEVHAVETRQQAKARQKSYPQLKVPEIIKKEINPDDIRDEQQEDETLKKIRQWAESHQEVRKPKGKIEWFEKNGLIYRKFTSMDENGKTFTQLVVPKKLREVVMKLAHESIMSGHLATSRTISRVLSEFYWPGVQSDIKRFCRSCDICQRTVYKGKVTKYPLQKMPLIDEPFKRVAVDIVGPIHPVTDKGNRYILTLVDYATRYPEAIPLKTIETERVAEALLDIFSRVGIPQEMLSDMGTQFTSSLMKEVSRLISVKQITTTPYHPMTNGMVERFNGTLKQMLKRMCSDRPKDWDKYINAVLFAYREVPQESLGFSPF